MKKGIAAFASLLLATPAAFAGGQYTGIARPFYYSNTFYIDTTGMSSSSRPSCATRAYVRLQEADTDPIFKNKFAMLMAAWFSEKPLTLSGTGACTGEGDEIIFVIWPT